MPTWTASRNQKIMAKLKSAILETKDIRDLLKQCSYNSFVEVDLDNTLLESTKEIGTDQWYAKLFEYACKTIPDKSEARQLVFTILHEVQYRIKVKAVEPSTALIIHILQDLGIPVIGITSRGADLIEPTIRQLNEIGIDLSKNWGKERIQIHVKDAPRPVYFQNGTLFCSGHNKGPCDIAFFQHFDLHPQHVVMADDNKENLDHVSDELKESGIDFVGLRYGYLDDKVAKFDMYRATTELFEISSTFSSDGKQAIEKLNIKKFVEHRSRSNSLLSQSFFSNKTVSELLEKEKIQEKNCACSAA